MANETTTTSANDFVLAAELLASRILPHFYGHNNAAGLTRYESIAGSPTKAADFPIASGLAAAALSEGVDAPYTQYSTTKTTLTVSEVGLVLAITDMLDASSIVGNEHYAAQMGMAMANKVTTDIFALNAGFSSVVGTTNTNLSEANILDGIQTLAAAGIPGPYKGALHPQQWRDFVGGVGATITPAGAGGESAASATNTFGAEPAFSGGINRFYGVDWVISSNVPTMAAGVDRAGVILNPQFAIGYLSKWDARVAIQRDETLRATELVCTAAYAVGELLDAAGVTVQTDAD